MKKYNLERRTKINIVLIVFIISTFIFFDDRKFDLAMFVKIGIIGAITYFLIWFSSKNKTNKKDDEDYFKDLK